MPLIRKPYNQDQAEADYKAAGQVDTGSGQYNQDIGIMEPSKNTYGTGRLPGGFVNTDRLLSQNQGLIDTAKQNVNQIGADIGNFTSGLRGKIVGGSPTIDTAPKDLSVGEILDYAMKKPEELKKAFNWRAADPADVEFNESAYDPLLKKITDTTGSVGLKAENPDPFKYGLLKTGGAIQDNTLIDYIDKIRKDRGDVATETSKYNQLGDEKAKNLNDDYSTKFTQKLQGILNEALPQLKEIHPEGAIKVGGKDYTSTRGGEWKEREDLLGALKNIGGILGYDPNTIYSNPIDPEWYVNLNDKGKKPPVQKPEDYESGEYGEVGKHTKRQRDASMYNY